MEGNSKKGNGTHHLLWGFGLLLGIVVTILATRSYDKKNVATLIPTGTTVTGTGKA